MEVLQNFLLMFWEVCGCIVRSAMRWVVRPKQKDVSGAICLVTGAAGNVGRRFALEFARKGVLALVLWDEDREGMEETVRLVKGLGVRAYPYTCDVSQKNEVYATARRVQREVGDVAILVNNASIVPGEQFFQCEDDVIERRMRMNCHAHFWMVKCFLPRMMEKKKGHIVTVSSHLGLVAAPYQEDFCASQFAAVGLHESLSHALKSKNIDGVKTTLICPYLTTHTSTDTPSIRPELEAFFSSTSQERDIRKAVGGILSEQDMVCTPRILYFAALLKHVVPWEVQLLCYKFLEGEKRTQ
ncbi:retinol dehydrogenase 10-like [Rana temporaria]|uniref:retinol dehydrogenase 10-like n=1 Tax=Rana temporaria TaxID=8407 RepID=UPI001AADD432|nr:retinol dehydrogenase 10-like [Rana temporaria]